MYMTIPTVPDSIAVTGPVRTFRSSDWAERAFCDTCGSALWYMTLHDQTRQLSAGLFDDAAGHRLALEFFADHVPAGYALAGDHRRMSEAECIALFGDGENG